MEQVATPDLHGIYAQACGKTIERARGVVQARLGITEDEAYGWLRKAAMDERLPLVEVARRTLEAQD